MKWRGFKPLRKLTRNPNFNYTFYVAIFVNMYVMTYSEVVTDGCQFKYVGDDAIVHGASGGGGEQCVRGAQIDETRPEYMLYDGINNICALLFALELILRFLSEGFKCE